MKYDGGEGGLPVNIFLGLKYFQGGLRNFRGGIEKFLGWGLKTFGGGG